jgi:Resolvase, N terminal domain
MEKPPRHPRRQHRRVTRYAVYLRVSTARQGASGLGIEAQREAVARYVTDAGGQIVAEVVETESGKQSNRPELARALAVCRAHRVTLLIAKLDRSTRNVAFIAGLMEAGVPFVAADMPTAPPSWPSDREAVRNGHRLYGMGIPPEVRTRFPKIRAFLPSAQAARMDEMSRPDLNSAHAQLPKKARVNQAGGDL